MAAYRVDRALLEQKSTEEIVRILTDERDDYTDEALEVLEEILAQREVETLTGSVGPVNIQSADDAIPVMNHILNSVLRRDLEPEIGEAAAQIIMCILQAIDQKYMMQAREGR